MIDKDYILDDILPLNQDFKGIKEKGLSYIQEYSGMEWTNFNPSDPGITILDQVCFALTELGYCNNFPIQDILTAKDGSLALENQFYTPQQILTTSPITIQDYQKYLIDGVTEIENVVIEPINSYISEVSHVYRIHLYINSIITEPTVIDSVCKTAFYLLNESRNLGELFLMPKPLKKKMSKLFGTIEIEEINRVEDLLGKIRETIEELIFPKIIQKGYESLKEEGIEPNKIFNGPILKNGWIDSSTLKEKPSIIHAEELSYLISAITGVISVSNVSFNTTSEKYTVSSKKNELLVIDLVDAIEKQTLIITCKGRNVYDNKVANQSINITPRKTSPNDIGATIQLQPKLPSGSYRDINNYYSIQNTFPEVFAVGSSSIEVDASPFKIAQSRQLRGYLTLFDQQLANQFSQLGNIPQLFSFVNSISGTPSDREQFYAQQNKLNKENSEYPIPYQKFSPTYFYQSLYDIQCIKPLLKNNNAFDFNLEFADKQDIDNDSWKKYKKDPYNAYIKGLMQIMEDDEVGLTRRNEMLDHLLARHGESPQLINTIIDPSIYTGDDTKGLVIFKSLLLQNLGLLSYYRQKSVNYIGADQLNAKLNEIPNEFFTNWLETYHHDFIFDAHKVDQEEKIVEKDFNNYSGFELKLSLIFGLKAIYKNFITATIQEVQEEVEVIEQKEKEHLQLASWMIENRKGVICLETGLLLKSINFQIAYLEGGNEPKYHIVQEKINYHSALGIEQLFRVDLQKSNVTLSESTTIKVSENIFSVVKVEKCDWATDLWQTIPGTKNKIAIGANLRNDKPVKLDHTIFNYSVLLYFPEFVPQFTTIDFIDRVKTLVESTLPIHTETDINIISEDQLKQLIPTFCNWRNSLRKIGLTDQEQIANELEQEETAIELILLMINLQQETND